MATDVHKYSNAELYVHLHPSFFAYTIFNVSSDQFEIVEAVMHDGRSVINNKELSHWLSEHQHIFNQAYTITKISINATAFSLLDNKDLATVEHFSTLNDYQATTEMLLVDESWTTGCIQYAIKKSVYKILLGYFDKQDIHYGDIGLLTAIDQFDEPDSFGICQILQDEATITIVKNGQLQLFNKFTIKNSEDLLYYILLCFQSNDLDPNTNRLFVCGLIESDAPMYQLIYEYVRNVELVPAPNSTVVLSPERDWSHHYFYNLLNMRT